MGQLLFLFLFFLTRRNWLTRNYFLNCVKKSYKLKMSKTLHQRGSSVPDQLTEEAYVSKKKSAFPKDYDHAGWLDVRTRATKSWKRRYFVLANNFLLCGITPHATKLEKVIPLEGSNVKTTIRTSNMTFEILHKKKRHQFRAGNNGECTAWTEKISRASRLKIKDVYQLSFILFVLEIYNITCNINF